MNQQPINSASSSGGTPAGSPASVDALVSEAMDLELAGDHASARRVWEIVREKHPAAWPSARLLREGLASGRDVSADARTLGESAAARAMARLRTQHAVVGSDESPFALAKRRVSPTLVAFALGACVTAGLFITSKVAGDKAREPNHQATASAWHESIDVPVVDDPSFVRRVEATKLALDARQYEQFAGTNELRITGGSGETLAMVQLSRAWLRLGDHSVLISGMDARARSRFASEWAQDARELPLAPGIARLAHVDHAGHARAATTLGEAITRRRDAEVLIWMGEKAMP